MMKTQSLNKTFNIHTVGCKTNQSESDQIARTLINHGFHPVCSASNPDIVIINTCTVTSAADKKVRQYIRRVRSLNPDSEIIVTGCHTVFNKSEINNLGANLIIFNEEKEKIPDIIIRSSRNSLNKANKINTNVEIRRKSQIYATSGILAQNSSLLHSRALIKIQDGCEQSCSYCIVPFVRGKYFSVQPGDVIKKVKYFVLSGYEEVVFTGIHIGKYGIDLSVSSYGNETEEVKKESNYGKSLAGLLKNVLENTDVKRIRLSSLEINEIDMDLMNIMKLSGGRIATHLHIPLQSGSEKILRAMNRKYTYSFFRQQVKKLREEFPQVALTTDIIVGFPQETEKDFEDTMEAIKESGFIKTHVFKYSRRQNTAAINLHPHIEENIKLSRSRAARELGEKMRQQYTDRFIGRILKVACETFDKKNKTACGTSDNYLKVYFKMEEKDFKLSRCKLLDIMVENKLKDGLIGTVV